jgi:phosphate transport system permease protein
MTGTWLRSQARVVTFTIVAVALSVGALLGLPAGAAATWPPETLRANLPGLADEAEPTPTAGTATVTVTPASGQVAAGASVTVDLKITTTGQVGNLTANLTFDKTLLQVEKIAPGPVWSGATVRAGNVALDEAIAQANSSGVLTKVSVAVPLGPASDQGVDGVFLSITMKGIANGTSALALTGLVVIDAQGLSMLASGSDGQLIIGSGGGSSPSSGRSPGAGVGPVGGAGGGSSPLPMVAVVLALVLLGGIFVIRSRRRGEPGVWMRRWPFVASLMLGLIPVVVFAGMVAMLVINSLPVLNDPGLGGLLGDTFSGKFHGNTASLYGLLPAVAGTVLIAAIAILVALPVSLALAIVSTEFPMGPVGRVVRPLVGLLSGIPPLVYALSVLPFVTLFMIPKFTADSTFSTFQAANIGANPATWPPAGVPWNAGALPWGGDQADPNSTLMGGLLIALLVIPFITPMIADAIRGVPSAAREASLALGANRGYTLRKVILPRAMPGIVGAVALGTLKAFGDVLIVTFVVGYEATSIPNPPFDVLERTPSLAAEGAGLLTVLGVPGNTCQPTQCAVGYSSAVVLLLVAAVIVLLMSYMQSRWRRRMGE